MEERKLIRLGNSSFAIALPKEWVSKSGLNKGDKVFLERNGNGEIVVSPKYEKIKNEQKKINFNLEGKDEKEIKRDLVSAYIGGNYIINITGSKDKIKIVKQNAKKFLDLELIEENEKGAVFKDLLDFDSIEIENFIKRMDNNIKDMFSILLHIPKEEKLLQLKIKELEEIDGDITKFYFLIWRIMNIGIDNPTVQVNLKINPKSFVIFFWFSYNLEQIGDELKRIARKIPKTKEGKTYFVEIIRMISDNYNKSMKSFFDKDKALSKEAVLRREELIKSCENLSKIRGFETIAEKFQQITASIHHNSKMIFYGL